MSRISFSSVITVNQGYVHVLISALLYSIQGFVKKFFGKNNGKI